MAKDRDIFFLTKKLQLIPSIKTTNKIRKKYFIAKVKLIKEEKKTVNIIAGKIFQLVELGRFHTNCTILTRENIF